LKKEKNSTKQSESILLPVLSKKEAEPDFLEIATKGTKNIILLLVIDTNAMAGEFGTGINNIREGNAIMEAVRKALGQKRKHAEEIMEWGDTLTKIDHIARLKEVDKIVLSGQDNQYFEELVKKLREKKFKIEIIQSNTSPNPSA
jgi:hypothetical protein